MMHECPYCNNDYETSEISEHRRECSPFDRPPQDRVPEGERLDRRNKTSELTKRHEERLGERDKR